MGAIPNTPACGCLRWVLASLLFLSHAEAYNHTWNRNYFNFPPLTDWIPVFRVGDTLNISWSTEFPQRNIAVWCGPDFYLGTRSLLSMLGGTQLTLFVQYNLLMI